MASSPTAKCRRNRKKTRGHASGLDRGALGRAGRERVPSTRRGTGAAPAPRGGRRPRRGTRRKQTAHGRRRRAGVRAVAVVGHEAGRPPPESLQVARPRLARLHGAQDAGEARRAHRAGRALAARLALEEAGERRADGERTGVARRSTSMEAVPRRGSGGAQRVGIERRRRPGRGGQRRCRRTGGEDHADARRWRRRPAPRRRAAAACPAAPRRRPAGARAPRARRASSPSRRNCVGIASAAGTRDSVSTFCTSVGRPWKPTAAGSGGLGRGQARRPSRASSSGRLLARDVAVVAATDRDRRGRPQARPRSAASRAAAGASNDAFRKTIASRAPTAAARPGAGRAARPPGAWSSRSGP